VKSITPPLYLKQFKTEYHCVPLAKKKKKEKKKLCNFHKLNSQILLQLKSPYLSNSKLMKLLNLSDESKYEV
jgi:hypothetical protein